MGCNCHKNKKKRIDKKISESVKKIREIWRDSKNNTITIKVTSKVKVKKGN